VPRRTVSQVVESRIDGLAAGDFVFNTNGWAEYGLMGEGVARPSYMVPRKLDPARGKISHAVGVLGMLGLTAYAGMALYQLPYPLTVISAHERWVRDAICCGMSMSVFQALQQASTIAL
jgi:NADPH-dependent curcumin reductase CurA